jgi:deoxyribonuclease V
VLIALDVHYSDDAASVACVGFERWDADTSSLELVLRDDTPPAAYEPGQFYKRELPHLLRAIEAVRARHAIDAGVIDAHVWLDGGAPGLGAHLYEALQRSTTIIGVAKTAYRGATAIEVTRGESSSPLFVSAAGIDPPRAADHVRAMHGPHRIPTLLKRTDALARGHEPPDSRKQLG